MFVDGSIFGQGRGAGRGEDETVALAAETVAEEAAQTVDDRLADPVEAIPHSFCLVSFL